MPRPLGHIRIMASSRVLLNLERADAVFKRAYHTGYDRAIAKGKDPQEAEQIGHEIAVRKYTDYVCARKIHKDAYDPEIGGRRFEKGPLWDFAKAALDLNAKFDEPLVELVMSCKDEPESAMPIFRNIDISDELTINGRIATSGSPISEADHKAYDTDILLTRNPHDAQNAIDMGIAAATIFMPPHSYNYAPSEGPVKIWVDGDAVAFGSSSEVRFREEGLERYAEMESEEFDKNLEPGPFTQVLAKMSEVNARFPRGEQPFEIALVTSRGHTSAARAFKIAQDHGIHFNDRMHFLAGADKANVIKQNNPHLYLDDQMTHLTDTGLSVPSGLVLYPTDSAMHKHLGQDVDAEQKQMAKVEEQNNARAAPKAKPA